jgi:MinD-like ATPase involved in chromosome partitioning or flagellar assembly
LDISLGKPGTTSRGIDWNLVMIVRFDDSLPILAEVVAKELGESVLRSGLVVRDATGRLAFISSKHLNQKTSRRLSTFLQRELGPYARTDRVVAGINDFGVAEIIERSSPLVVQVGQRQVRLVDRRLAGADWIREPSDMAQPPPRFVFASLKGGVGRSTTLCVTAAELASHGYRVLAIDLDMEAPGLGAMLLDEGTLPDYGVIDALVENGLAPLDDTFLADLVGPSALTDRRGRVDVIPAFGRRSLRNPGEVLAKIARAYTEDIKPDGTLATILDQVRTLVDAFADPIRYDAILVDCRAGLHETTASAILGLGAEVFLFGLDEPQTFQGYSALVSHLARFRRHDGSRINWVERLAMVQGKATDANSRSNFAEKSRALFSPFYSDSLESPEVTGVPLPAAPFSDVPWDDDDNIDDDDLGIQDEVLVEVIAVLEDDKFKLFEPARRQDLLSEVVYRSPFGDFLTRIRESMG